MRISSYGVRPVEEAFFHKLNTYKYELNLIQELQNDDNIELCQGSQAVILRGNCKADKHNLTLMKNFGIEYILTRTVGYDHIDLAAVKELGFKFCARVPSYSPTAISELAVSLALGLSRKTFAMNALVSQKDFTAYDHYFAKEVRHSIVGIIGAGRIGLCSVRAFQGLGAHVLAYDPYPSEEAQKTVELTSLDKLLQESDIILLHSPYFKDKNHHMVDKSFVAKMKKGSILVNTARGELIDTQAVLEGIEQGKLAGLGLDVLEGEAGYFFKNFNGQTIPDPLVEKLHSYYPKVVITPHLASFTDEALTNMIEITYKNLNDFLQTGVCSNSLS